jgi:hypothetical protein
MIGLLHQMSVQTLNLPCRMPANDGDPSISAAPTPVSAFVEKRREVRYRTFEEVEVCILDAESPRLHGILRDVSRSGLRMELSLPVKAGAHLEVVLHNQAIIFGEARYCRGSAHTYQVGVAIEDIYYPKSGPIASTCAEPQPWLDPDDRPRVAVGRGRFLSCPIAQELSGSHASPDDVAAFLHHDLSETKSAVMERHLAACQDCSNLMQLILEDSTSFVARIGNDTTHVQ